MFFIKKKTRLIFFTIKTIYYNYAPEILRKPSHFQLTCTAGKGSKYSGFRCQYSDVSLWPEGPVHQFGLL